LIEAFPLNIVTTKSYVGTLMSIELKTRLDNVVQEDRKQEENQLEADLPRLKAFLLKIVQAKKFDMLIWMEGTKQTDLNKDEADLALLERANLIKGKTKYTHRNVYRQYEPTQKGIELAVELARENES
jgi:hypothetical protein